MASKVELSRIKNEPRSIWWSSAVGKWKSLLLLACFVFLMTSDFIQPDFAYHLWSYFTLPIKLAHDQIFKIDLIFSDSHSNWPILLRIEDSLSEYTVNLCLSLALRVNAFALSLSTHVALVLANAASIILVPRVTSSQRFHPTIHRT